MKWVRSAWMIPTLAVLSGLVAHGLRNLVPWIGQLEQPLARRLLPAPTSSSFLIAAVSPESFKKAGVPVEGSAMRQTYARFIDAMKQAGAKGVVFDIVFDQEGTDPNPNQAFARSIQSAPPMQIVLPAIPVAVQADRSTFEKPRFMPDDAPVVYGFVRSHPDDGVADLIVSDGFDTFYHISALAVAVAEGLRPYEDVHWDGHRLKVGNRTIATDANGRVLIREAEVPIPVLAFDDLLKNPAQAAGKVVIVGIVEGNDRQSTAVGEMEGIEWVGLIAASISKNTAPSASWAPGWVSAFLAIGLALLAGASIIGLHLLRSVMGVVGATALGWFLPTWLLGSVGLVDTMTSWVAIGLTAVAAWVIEAQVMSRRVYGRAQPFDEDLTVMFVDLANSTLLVRELGPAGADQVMTAIIQRLADVVEFRGAEIERPLGDGVLAHWRGKSPEDQLQRCLDAIPALNAILQDRPIRGVPPDFELALTFGIEYGHVVGSAVRVRGLPQWMSSGETVNLAARVQSLCSTVGVSCLLGPAAGRVVGPSRAGPAGIYDLKGFGDIEVYRLLEPPC